MKILVAMKWVETEQEWFMSINGRFIMKFPDCENIHRIFDKELNKKETKTFNIDVNLRK